MVQKGSDTAGSIQEYFVDADAAMVERFVVPWLMVVGGTQVQTCGWKRAEAKSALALVATKTSQIRRAAENPFCRGRRTWCARPFLLRIHLA